MLYEDIFPQIDNLIVKNGSLNFCQGYLINSNKRNIFENMYNICNDQKIECYPIISMFNKVFKFTLNTEPELDETKARYVGINHKHILEASIHYGTFSDFYQFINNAKFDCTKINQNDSAKFANAVPHESAFVNRLNDIENIAYDYTTFDDAIKDLSSIKISGQYEITIDQIRKIFGDDVNEYNKIVLNLFVKIMIIANLKEDVKKFTYSKLVLAYYNTIMTYFMSKMYCEINREKLLKINLLEQKYYVSGNGSLENNKISDFVINEIANHIYFKTYFDSKCGNLAPRIELWYTAYYFDIIEKFNEMIITKLPHQILEENSDLKTNNLNKKIYKKKDLSEIIEKIKDVNGLDQLRETYIMENITAMTAYFYDTAIKNYSVFKPFVIKQTGSINMDTIPIEYMFDTDKYIETNQIKTFSFPECVESTFYSFFKYLLDNEKRNEYLEKAVIDLYEYDRNATKDNSLRNKNIDDAFLNPESYKNNVVAIFERDELRYTKLFEIINISNQDDSIKKYYSKILCNIEGIRYARNIDHDFNYEMYPDFINIANAFFKIFGLIIVKDDIKELIDLFPNNISEIKQMLYQGLLFLPEELIVESQGDTVDQLQTAEKYAAFCISKICQLFEDEKNSRGFNFSKFAGLNSFDLKFKDFTVSIFPKHAEVDIPKQEVLEDRTIKKILGQHNKNNAIDINLYDARFSHDIDKINPKSNIESFLFCNYLSRSIDQNSIYINKLRSFSIVGNTSDSMFKIIKNFRHFASIYLNCLREEDVFYVCDYDSRILKMSQRFDEKNIRSISKVDIDISRGDTITYKQAKNEIDIYDIFITKLRCANRDDASYALIDEEEIIEISRSHKLNINKWMKNNSITFSKVNHIINSEIKSIIKSFVANLNKERSQKIYDWDMVLSGNYNYSKIISKIFDESTCATERIQSAILKNIDDLDQEKLKNDIVNSSNKIINKVCDPSELINACGIEFDIYLPDIDLNIKSELIKQITKKLMHIYLYVFNSFIGQICTKQKFKFKIKLEDDAFITMVDSKNIGNEHILSVEKMLVSEVEYEKSSDVLIYNNNNHISLNFLISDRIECKKKQTSTDTHIKDFEEIEIYDEVYGKEISKDPRKEFYRTFGKCVFDEKQIRIVPTNSKNDKYEIILCHNRTSCILHNNCNEYFLIKTNGKIRVFLSYRRYVRGGGSGFQDLLKSKGPSDFYETDQLSLKNFRSFDYGEADSTLPKWNAYFEDGEIKELVLNQNAKTVDIKIPIEFAKINFTDIKLKNVSKFVPRGIYLSSGKKILDTESISTVPTGIYCQMFIESLFNSDPYIANIEEYIEKMHRIVVSLGLKYSAELVMLFKKNKSILKLSDRSKYSVVYENNKINIQEKTSRQPGKLVIDYPVIKEIPSNNYLIMCDSVKQDINIITIFLNSLVSEVVGYCNEFYLMINDTYNADKDFINSKAVNFIVDQCDKTLKQISKMLNVGDELKIIDETLVNGIISGTTIFRSLVNKFYKKDTVLLSELCSNEKDNCDNIYEIVFNGIAKQIILFVVALKIYSREIVFENKRLNIFKNIKNFSIATEQILSELIELTEKAFDPVYKLSQSFLDSYQNKKILD